MSQNTRDISHFVAATLIEIGATPWLEGGSLLGAARENGNLLDWEDDIDISVVLDKSITSVSLAASLINGAHVMVILQIYSRKNFI